ncbi:lysylphosphatidylglycerol synthase transmembrane domain-containing protein [Altericista sp. CCNU0014]|uniref:lysylphosphatidylglycerol synthase transmembrane domain-containing protein n=1 Tax=Altericista sp. CCNU0014 TaxID=3082949 RepID=UPI00384BA87A
MSESGGKTSLKWRRWLALALGTAITLLLVAWVVRDISWAEVGKSLGRSHWGWFGVGLATYLLCFAARARRWGTILENQGFESSFQTRLAALLIGFGSNSILPAYFGPLLRTGILNRKEGIPVELALGSIFAERMLDLGIVLMFLVLPLSLRAVPALSSLNASIVLSLSVGLLCVWILCIVGARDPKRTIQRLNPIFATIAHPRLKARLQTGLQHFLSGLAALSQPRPLSKLLLESLCAWLLNGATYWTGLLAFEAYRPGFIGALFIQSGAALAIAIPSTPGYIGPFEASLQVLLGLYEIPAATILSYAIAMRVVMYVTVPAIAMVLGWRLGLLHWLGATKNRKQF